MADPSGSGAGTTPAGHRTVALARTPQGRLEITNERGGRLLVGRGADGDFTPVELLLAALGACTAVDVEVVTSRRAEPESFEVRVDATKVTAADGNRLDDLAVVFRARFPEGAAGDAARELLPTAVRKSHDRWCTVSRTLELGTPVATRLE